MPKKVVIRCDAGTAKGPTGCSGVRMLSTGITPWARDASLTLLYWTVIWYCSSWGGASLGLGAPLLCWGKFPRRSQLKNCQLSTLPTAGEGEPQSWMGNLVMDTASYHLPLVPLRSHSSVCGNRPLGLVYYLLSGKLRKFSGINYSTCFWSWTWSYNWNSSLSPPLSFLSFCILSEHFCWY